MILRNKDKEKLINIFSKIDLDFEVWAYGSRVNGQAHEGSDLDLVIRRHNLNKLPIDVYLDLKDQIQESTIPIVVELFDWPRLPESFHKNIEASHEVLYRSAKVGSPALCILLYFNPACLRILFSVPFAKSLLKAIASRILRSISSRLSPMEI